MGVIVSDNGGEFEPIPTGLYRALCVNYFDIGYQRGYRAPGEDEKPPVHKVVLLWEIEPVSPTTSANSPSGTRRSTSRRVGAGCPG